MGINIVRRKGVRGGKRVFTLFSPFTELNQCVSPEGDVFRVKALIDVVSDSPSWITLIL